MLTRRAFLYGTAVVPVSAWAQTRPAEFSFSQYHNQTASSPLHLRLVEMWDAIRAETNGRVATRIFPENNKHPGSDPAVLQMLVSGEIEFFTLMGGILGNAVPVAEVQQVPFAFRDAAHAQRAVDGPLGAYLRSEMAAKGIHGFAVGAFDNGMRQVAGTRRAIVVPRDLAGLKMRVPAGKMFEDTFRALGAETMTVNSSGIYSALKTGVVDAQENPLAYMDLFKHYEVMKYVSMTNHMWSGFNMLAHRPTWQRLPADVQSTIERNVTKYVRLQRQDQEAANVASRTNLAKQGLAFNEVSAAPFQKQLAGVYASWKKTLGTKCWSLLQAETGTLG